jgi:hypothetical protein
MKRPRYPIRQSQMNTPERAPNSFSMEYFKNVMMIPKFREAQLH